MSSDWPRCPREGQWPVQPLVLVPRGASSPLAEVGVGESKGRARVGQALGPLGSLGLCAPGKLPPDLPAESGGCAGPSPPSPVLWGRLAAERSHRVPAVMYAGPIAAKKGTGDPTCPSTEHPVSAVVPPSRLTPCSDLPATPWPASEHFLPSVLETTGPVLPDPTLVLLWIFWVGGRMSLYCPGCQGQRRG